MLVVMTPVGSGGDVNPYIGIGSALKRRGHDVILMTSEPFHDAARRAGLEFVATLSSDEYERVAANPDVWHPRRGPQLLFGLVADRLQPAWDLLSDVYRPGETMLVGHPLSVATRSFEEKHHIPGVTLHLAPIGIRTLYQQSAYEPGKDVTRMPLWFKRTWWWLLDRFMIDPLLVPPLNKWRASLGMPPVKRIFRDWINSPHGVIGLFPPWFCEPQPDWPERTTLTGFPMTDLADLVDTDPGLDDFIAAGDPPIACTAGTSHRQAAHFFGALAEACEILGKRAVFLTRYPEQLPDPLPDGIRHESYAPFSRILPRCAAIAHHGGIGTMAQGFAAGIPQLTMPQSFDQPDNVTRLQRLGAGTWLEPGDFAGRKVARLLGELISDVKTLERCSGYAELMRGDEPVERACDAIEGVMQGADSAG